MMTSSRGPGEAGPKHRRPALNTDTEMQEAKELVALGFGKPNKVTTSPGLHSKSKDELEDDLTLAIALSKSMMMKTSGEVQTVEPNVANSSDAAESNSTNDTSNGTADCSNDFAIALALSSLDGESAGVADLHSIQLEEDCESSMIIIDGNDDDAWSYVIQGDLQDMISSIEQLTDDGADRWSIVSDEQAFANQRAEAPLLLPSYKDAVESNLKNQSHPDSPAPAVRKYRAKNTRPGSPKALLQHTETDDDSEDVDPFTDWEHFKYTRGGKAHLRFKGNQQRNKQLESLK